MSNPITKSKKGVIITVKTKPASHYKPPSIVHLAEGNKAIEISVAEPPEGGKANKAIISFLAKELRIPKGDIEIKSGFSSRIKILEISAKDEKTLKAINQWLCSLDSN